MPKNLEILKPVFYDIKKIIIIHLKIQNSLMDFSIQSAQSSAKIISLNSSFNSQTQNFK